eukprot:4757425-Prymnesium_polylepis.1
MKPRQQKRTSARDPQGEGQSVAPGMAPILCRVGLALVVLSWSEAEAILGSRPAVLLSSHRVRSHSPRLALSESDVDVKKKEITECILDAETPEELAACMEEAEQNLFTLEPRDDGWNDVRTAVTAFKKERAGALEQLKSNYQRDTENIRSSPAYRWTKVRRSARARGPHGRRVRIAALSRRVRHAGILAPGLRLTHSSLARLPGARGRADRRNRQRRREGGASQGGLAERAGSASAALGQPAQGGAAQGGAAQ